MVLANPYRLSGADGEDGGYARRHQRWPDHPGDRSRRESQRHHPHSGLPFPSTRERCEMLEEAITIIRRLWTEPSSVDFNGQRYQVAGASIEPKPTQPTGAAGSGGWPRPALCPPHHRADSRHQQRRLQRQPLNNIESTPASSVRRPRWWAAILRASNSPTTPIASSRPRNASMTGYVARLAEDSGMTATAYQSDRLRNTLSGTPEQICDRIQDYVVLRHSILFRSCFPTRRRRRRWPSLPARLWNRFGSPPI